VIFYLFDADEPVLAQELGHFPRDIGCKHGGAS